MRIVEEAAAKGARPVTTAKDAVRLPPEARAMVEVVEVGIVFADEAALEALLDGVLADLGPVAAS
jgi:tetraacyldisaccharide 4'-kinase